MAQILLQGCNTNKCLKTVSIHTQLLFSDNMPLQKQKQKTDEINAKLYAVLQEYFTESEVVTDDTDYKA